MTDAQLLALFASPHIVGVADQLLAVAQGQRRVATYGFMFDDVVNGDPDEQDSFGALLLQCQKYDLVATLSVYDDLIYADVYVSRSVDMPRVSQLIALQKMRGRYSWSDGAEALKCSLLGYNTEEVEAWLAHRRLLSAAWGHETVYLLMSDRQRDAVVSAGSRCLPGDHLHGEVQAFIVLDELVVVGDALERSGGAHIARFAARQPILELFGEAPFYGRSLVSTMIGEKAARTVNTLMESPVEFYNGTEFVRIP